MRFWQSFVLFICGVLCFQCANSQTESRDLLLPEYGRGVLICNQDTMELQKGKTDVYSLVAAKLNLNQYRADNELQFQYLDSCLSEYVFDFDIDEKLLSFGSCELSFECSDISYSIYVNQREVPKKQNNTLRFHQQIRQYLKEGKNEIRIKIEPVKPRWDNVKSEDYDILSSETRAVFRHAAFQFGWDWAPRELAGEVFMPLRLHFASSPCKVLNAGIQTIKADSLNADMSLSVMLSDSTNDISYAKVYYCDEKGKRFRTKKLEPSSIKTVGGYYFLNFDFSISRPHLWQPQGAGEQCLYQAGIKLYDKNQKEIESIDTRFGIRQIELIREKDSIGESFYFVCNGQKLFAKGANLVPTKMHGEKYSSLAKHINLVKDCNMNMLRVWGGGFYLDEESLKACDENGILIWQDFPFACALYPADSFYLQGVASDAAFEVARIASHPCLALLCGNNEVFEGWENWGWKSQVRDTAVALANYNKLFKQLLPQIASVAAQSTDYVHTSPIHGWGKAQSMTEGDSHYWGAWWGDSVFETYTRKVPRFMSEYGFQSPPSKSCMEQFFTLPYSKDNPQFAIHQKHSRRFELIDNRLKERFSTIESDRDYWQKAEITASDAYKIAIEAHRRAMPRCMGSLLWQLNEPYPAISWSMIDATWQPKAVYYTIKKCFAPFLLSIDTYSSTDSLFVYFVNDTYSDIELTCTLEIRDEENKTVLQIEIKDDNLPKMTSRKIYSLAKNSIPNFDPTRHFALIKSNGVSLKQNGESVEQNAVLSQQNAVSNYAFFVYPQQLENQQLFFEIRNQWLQEKPNSER